MKSGIRSEVGTNCNVLRSRVFLNYWYLSGDTIIKDINIYSIKNTGMNLGSTRRFCHFSGNKRVGCGDTTTVDEISFIDLLPSCHLILPYLG